MSLQRLLMCASEEESSDGYKIAFVFGAGHSQYSTNKVDIFGVDSEGTLTNIGVSTELNAYLNITTNVSGAKVYYGKNEITSYPITLQCYTPYTYTVLADGYNPYTLEYTPQEMFATRTENVVLEESTQVKTINISGITEFDTPTIEFSYSGFKLKTVSGDTASITFDSDVEYVVKCTGYKTVKGTLSGSETVNVTMVETLDSEVDIVYPFTDWSEYTTNLKSGSTMDGEYLMVASNSDKIITFTTPNDGKKHSVEVTLDRAYKTSYYSSSYPSGVCISTSSSTKSYSSIPSYSSNSYNTTPYVSGSDVWLFRGYGYGTEATITYEDLLPNTTYYIHIIDRWYSSSYTRLRIKEIKFDAKALNSILNLTCNVPSATYIVNGEMLDGNTVLLPLNTTSKLLVQADGYALYSEDIVVGDIASKINKSVTLSTTGETYSVTTDVPTTITFKVGDTVVKETTGTTSSILVSSGTEIGYEVKADGYKAVKGTLNDSSKSVSLTMEESRAIIIELAYPFTENAEYLTNLVDNSNFYIRGTGTAPASCIASGSKSYNVNSGFSGGYIEFTTPDTTDTSLLTVSVTCANYTESMSYDWGCCFINTKLTLPTTNVSITTTEGSTNSTYGDIIWTGISTGNSSTFYTRTKVLQPNTKYYLMFYYRKDGSVNSNWDRMAISNIKLPVVG